MQTQVMAHISQIQERKLNLSVAYVSGDDLLDSTDELIRDVVHLGSENTSVKLTSNTTAFLDDLEKPIICCDAYWVLVISPEVFVSAQIS
jgi:hypothetical protein